MRCYAFHATTFTFKAPHTLCHVKQQYSVKPIEDSLHKSTCQLCRLVFYKQGKQLNNIRAKCLLCNAHYAKIKMKKKKYPITCFEQQYPPNPWCCRPHHPVTFSPQETQSCPCAPYYFERVQARLAEFCFPSTPLQSRTADWLQSGDRQSHIPGIRLMLFGHLTESVPLLLAECQFLDTTPSRQQLVVLPTSLVLCN